jgi:hypothetical protein
VSMQQQQPKAAAAAAAGILPKELLTTTSSKEDLPRRMVWIHACTTHHGGMSPAVRLACSGPAGPDKWGGAMQLLGYADAPGLSPRHLSACLESCATTYQLATQLLLQAYWNSCCCCCCSRQQTWVAFLPARAATKMLVQHTRAVLQPRPVAICPPSAIYIMRVHWAHIAVPRVH